MGRVSVLIPNWNGRARLESLLPRLKSQTLAPAQVVVADDGSSDGSAEAAARLGAEVVRLPRRQGFAAAVNAGLRACTEEWIALLNNDVEPAPDWLERLLVAAESSKAWFACGKLLRQDDPQRLDGAFDLLCRGATAWRAGAGRLDGSVWDRPRRIHFAGFAAALVRRNLFEIAGPLDERFDSYLEDVDFCLRCALRALDGVYVPQARGRHAGSATLGRWSAASVRLIARNQLLLVALHFPPGWRRSFGRAVLVAQALWGLVALRRGAFRAWLKGKHEGWKMFHSVRGSGPSTDAGRLAALLAESEREILVMQRECGWDAYWRLYFLLAGKPPMPPP
ncbi:MAG: glycosyltransferase family 2 protein [Bryobacterales bacterium]|nr:glycosyltransferase family 2 protein [Bryobacteraceae bacterium]MDW8130763.1 glycosyltransferase family 2 protein [Bryobacterales bacterium]